MMTTTPLATPTAAGRFCSLAQWAMACLALATTVCPSGANAQALSTPQLVMQLRPPAQADSPNAGDANVTRGFMVMPTSEGRCDAAGAPSSTGQGQRNLEVVPAAPSTQPSATLELQFATGRHVLTAIDERQVANLAAALLHPDLLAASYNITGHTDSSGDPRQNLKLSCARATEVREQLIRRGVAASRLQAFGFGSARPRQPGNHADGANRRVEVRLAP
jgi:outer membrane protein OmpA-like peptidoglycan-associated protein